MLTSIICTAAIGSKVHAAGIGDSVPKICTATDVEYTVTDIVPTGVCAVITDTINVGINSMFGVILSAIISPLDTITGETAMQTVRNVRMNIAVGDLSRTTQTISDIGRKDGYPTSQSFTWAFKTYYAKHQANFDKAFKSHPLTMHHLHLPNKFRFQHSAAGRITAR